MKSNCSESMIIWDEATLKLLEDFEFDESFKSAFEVYEVPVEEPQQSSSAAGPMRNRKTKPPKPRTTFTKEQLKGLEERFTQKQYINRVERFNLGMQIGVPEEAIRTWFQNRRSRRNRHLQKSNVVSGSTAQPPVAQVIPQVTSLSIQQQQPQIPQLSPSPSEYFMPQNTPIYNLQPNYHHHPNVQSGYHHHQNMKQNYHQQANVQQSCRYNSCSKSNYHYHPYAAPQAN